MDHTNDGPPNQTTDYPTPLSQDEFTTLIVHDSDRTKGNLGPRVTGVYEKLSDWPKDSKEDSYAKNQKYRGKQRADKHQYPEHEPLEPQLQETFDFVSVILTQRSNCPQGIARMARRFRDA
jgi:hypothetical protein